MYSPAVRSDFAETLREQNGLRLATKKSYIITRKPLFNSILHVPYTKLIFKYASLPNLNFRSLQCSKNLCAKTLCRPGNTVYHFSILATNAPHTASLQSD